MSSARKQVTLSNLAEFSALMPQVPRDRVIHALGGLSVKCSLDYSLSKTFLRDGWVLEHRRLQTAVQLKTINDLLLFASSGELTVRMADGSEHQVGHGEQLVLRAGSQATLFPLGKQSDASLLALSVNLDLTWAMQPLDTGPVPCPQ